MHSGVTISTNDPNFPKSVTRVLQHSILQLCNEHISYNHTLQVLGVLCLTIDDKQQELVVKVNNTLKRVNAVTPPKDAAPHQPPSIPRGGGDTELCFPASDVPLMYERSCPNGAFPAQMVDQRHSERNGSPSGLVCRSGTGRRKAHGRKQTNPVRVKHVFDEGGGDILEGDVVTVEPTNPESPKMPEREVSELPSSGVSIPQSSPKRIGGIRKAKRKLSELFTSSKMISGIDQGNAPTERARFESADAAERSLNETGERAAAACDDSEDESHDSGCSQRLVVIAPDEVSSPENCEDLGTATADDEGALNFSMDALNGGTPQTQERSDREIVSSGRVETPITGPGQEFQNGLQHDINGIRIKEEIKAAYPVGLDLVMNANSYDVSQNLAIRSTFLDDFRFLPAVARGTSIVNGHLIASQNPLGTELCSTSNSALRYLGDPAAAGFQVLDEAYLRSMVNGLSVAQVAVGPSSYTISSCLTDGLKMNFTKTRTKDRSHLGGATSMKVKDIIMYDDSAPLHTQKGNKIEGDFMLDSLNVEGKKRRRRTAEDALTSEEIAEYMGSCDRNQCSFKCKYCNEVCADLSRYFNHTLVKHNSFICHQCGKNFTTKSSLLRHRPIHTGMRRFACSICKKSFYRKDKCKAHIKRHLGLTSDPPEKYPHASNLASP